MGSEGTPLWGLDGWTKAHIDALKGAWINTAEQVVGLAATPQGVESLAGQLSVSEAEAHRLVDSARAALPAATGAALSKKVDTSQMGLGALPPPAKRPRRPRGGN